MRIRALSCLLPLLAVTSIHASESDVAPRVPRPALGALFGEWQAEHGTNWRLHVALDTGYLEMLSGGKAQLSFEPRDDADFAVLARQALAQTVAMHGLEDSTLQLENSLHLPLGIIGSSDKMTVRFRQVVRGVPVEGGFANVLLDMHGALLSVQVTGSPMLASFPTSSTLDATRAFRRAVEWFRAEQGLVPSFVSEPGLVIDQVVDTNGQRAPRLAWKVNVQHVSNDASPVGKNVFVDAGTGVIYRDTESIHFFDVSGSVSSFASPGQLPDIAGNPPAAQPARFIRVTSGATTTFTDGNGDFTLPGVNAPASVTFQYANGMYANVQDSVAAEYSLTQTLNSPTGNAATMNSPASALITAQANCSRVVPLLRDFVKAINPSDTHADFAVRANTQIAGSCNAYYDGGSINFFNAQGSCSNTAYATVITHEEGHWMNDLYGTGNGPDGMGEGNADVWALYVFDTPALAPNFNGGGSLRSGNNTRAFCGDANPGCYLDVHTDGEPWMGAAWKVRNRLNTTYGNAMGDLIANSIFMGWMNGYDQTQIKSIIETQWLTLDDDDGNLGNGTPHFSQIDLGFRDQAFPGITLPPVSIANVTNLPSTTNQVGPYVVNATIEANQNPPVLTASLLYRIEGGSFTTLPMTNTGGNNWTVSIPGIAAPAHVAYYLTATNNAAQSASYPTTAPIALVDFDIGTVNVLRFHNFDTTNDEGWTHGSIGDTSSMTDDWQRSTPAGKSGTGWSDPTGAFSPSTCWGTDDGQGNSNGAYASNVHAYLRAPITNCSGATNVRLRFRRWLSVQGSGSDQARILVNGQQVYINPTTNMNDGAWTQQEVFLGPIANDNPSVQVEWRIKSNGSTNYGGWNIDDVQILWLAVPCPTPQNYCSTSPNSVGLGSILGFQGSPRISTNNFEVIATGLPPNSSGLFYYGTATLQQPFGNGLRCVGGAAFRLGILVADFFGDAHQPLDIPNLPGAITAGQTRYFQYWYRNPAGGGSGFNLSDGLQVQFCP